MKIYVDKKNRFVEKFNPETGYYMRTGVIDKDGNDTNEDPFMRNFPQLIDVGIVGFCQNAEKGICTAQCYQSGATKKMPNMSLEDYKTIVDQSKDKVFQFAVGGRGDPNHHENFKEILEYTRENGIVPNYTTSGYGLTQEQVDLTKKHCGAVAVSWYKGPQTYRAIEMFLNAGAKTNIHYVLGNNTIDEAIDKIKNDSFPKGINAVIFLLHKPVGQGSEENVLQPDDPKVKEFFAAVDQFNTSFKIGFDSCSVPGVLNFTSNVDRMSIDSCEGSRQSMYISADMKALPCSFDQDHRWAVDLKKYTIQQAWDSPLFENFRDSFRNSCSSCTDRKECMGGCPIIKNIALCGRQEKDLAPYTPVANNDPFLTKGWEKYGFGG